MTVLFHEKQRFTQWWIWVLLIGVNAVTIYGIIQQVIFKIPYGNNPSPDAVLLLVSLVPIGIAVLIYTLCLETQLTEASITIKFYPLVRSKTIQLKEIQKVYVRQYAPIREFGGWGYRVSLNGTAYNVRGNKGLQLELKNGKKILIGTQRGTELQSIIEKLDMQ